MTDHGLLRDVEVDGQRVDVEVGEGIVRRVGRAQPTATDTAWVVEGRGGALLPGLHDHHLHLAALAAADASTSVGPPDVGDANDLRRALSDADRVLPAGEWLRAVGYHESVAGDLDRQALDALVGERPVRVQHRSGVRWTLNSTALRLIHADSSTHPGIERDRDGAPTGRLDRADEWLRSRLEPSAFPDLAAIGRRLAQLGVTGVTDCTPFRSLDGPRAIAAAVAGGRLPQRVVLTGHEELLGEAMPAEVDTGPVKVVVDEHDLPDLDRLVGTIRRCHRAGRNVAMHLVTEAATAFALAAWSDAGARPGDRVEHGSLLTGPMLEAIRQLGLAVVTQPGFVAERGDEYLAEVEPGSLPHLYRAASLVAAGVVVAGSSDAPYTDPDPWRAIEAAVRRRTHTDVVLGAAERLDARTALSLFTRDPLRLDRHRTVAPGEPADLCLLHLPLSDALARPSAENVRATYRGGELVAGVDF